MSDSQRGDQRRNRRPGGLSRADATLAGIAAVGAVASVSVVLDAVPRVLVLGGSGLLWLALLADALFRNPPPPSD